MSVATHSVAGAGTGEPAGSPHVTLLLFAAAREAAGVRRDTLPGVTVGEVLATARTRYGPDFAAVLEACKVWLNGVPASPSDHLSPGDEVAVLPPVSGGATA
jgi:molybdopterin converting factor small subunit